MKTTHSKIPSGEDQVITWKFFLMPPRLVYPLRMMDVLCLSQSFSFLIHDLSVGFVARVTRHVSLVEQELLILPEHMSFC